MSQTDNEDVRSGEAHLITLSTFLLLTTYCVVLVLVSSLSLQELGILSTPEYSIHV